jgi:hypothetical protein
MLLAVVGDAPTRRGRHLVRRARWPSGGSTARSPRSRS